MDDLKQIRGKWWIPTNPDNRVTGVLTIHTNTSANLELDGSFPEVEIFEKDGNKRVISSKIERIDLVLGYGLNGKKYSLNNCDYSGGQLGFFHGITTQNFHVSIIFEGIHFSNKNEIKMHDVSASLNYLNAWMNPKTITWKNESDDDVIRGKRIENHKIELNDSINLNLRTNTHFHGSLTQITLEQRNYIDISSKEPIEFYLFMELIFHFQEFLSLIMLNPAFVTEIYADNFGESDSSDNKEIKEIIVPVKIYLPHSRLSEQIISKDLNFSDALFTLPEINGDVEAIIQKWFDLCQNQKSMLDLYFASVFTSKQYIQSNFLSKAQCLEVYHRHSENFVQDAMDPLLHNKKVDIIENLIRENENLKITHLKSYIKKIRKFGNEPTLENRLNSILSNYPDIFSIFIEDPKSFSKIVADNRNYLTHLEKKKGTIYATNIELYYFTVQLEAIIYVCILAELGFKKEKIIEIIQKFVLKKNLKGIIRTA